MLTDQDVQFAIHLWHVFAFVGGLVVGAIGFILLLYRTIVVPFRSGKKSRDDDWNKWRIDIDMHIDRHDEKLKGLSNFEDKTNVKLGEIFTTLQNISNCVSRIDERTKA